MLFILLFLLGICVGSFLNVVIDRLPRNEDIFRGRSYCETCKKPLLWFNLIPLVSYVILRGRCRFCAASISIRNPAVELITGVLFVLTFLVISPQQFSQVLNLVFYLFVESILVAIFFIDLSKGIIPDKLILPLYIISFLYLFLNLFLNNQIFTNHLLSGLGAFTFFFLLSQVTSGMGFGDVKLAGALGLILGFPNVILGIYLAFLTGAVASIILILWRKKILKDTIPFGPFLTAGAILSLLWGDLLASRLSNFLS